MCLCHVFLGHLQQSLVFVAAVPEGAHGADVEAVLTLANCLPALLSASVLGLLVSLAAVVLKTLLFHGCLLLPANVMIDIEMLGIQQTNTFTHSNRGK